MSSEAELILHALGIALCVAVVLTGSWAWRWRHRWGRVSGPSRMVGDGAYRRAIARSWAPRGTPPRVVAVAGIGIAWGLVTTIVLAPAGLLFLLSPARYDAPRQLCLMLTAAGVIGVATSGFALGVHLVRASRAMLRRERDLLEHTLPVAAWSGIHHALVAIVFAGFALHEGAPAVAIAVAVPCGIGWIHAWALTHAARFVSRLRDDEGDDDEGDDDGEHEERRRHSLIVESGRSADRA